MLAPGKVWNSQKSAFCNLKYELEKKKKKKMFEVWERLVLHVRSYTMHFEGSCKSMYYTFSKCKHIFHNYDRREKISRALVKDLIHENSVYFFSAFFFPVTTMLRLAAPLPLPPKQLQNHHSPLQNPHSFVFMTSR